MVSTIPLNEIEKHADNIYEAIIILAKRARQINDEQKRLYQQESDYDEGYEAGKMDILNEIESEDPAT